MKSLFAGLMGTLTAMMVWGLGYIGATGTTLYLLAGTAAAIWVFFLGYCLYDWTTQSVIQ